MDEQQETWTDRLSRLTGSPVEITPLPCRLGYFPALVKKETIKAGAGLTLCLALLVGLQPAPLIAWLLALVAGLFGLYLIQQLARLRLRMELSEAGLTLHAWYGQRRMEWDTMQQMRLHFYSHGREKQQGVLVLHLSAPGFRVKVDSTLEGFPALLAQATQVARSRALFLHPTTQANLAQLGL